MLQTIEVEIDVKGHINVLGREVQIIVKPKPRSLAMGKLKVVCA